MQATIEKSRMCARRSCRSLKSVYDACITKPPEGLGVRLVSAGPLFFFLLAAIAQAGCATSEGPVALHPSVSLRRNEAEVQVQAVVACARGDLEQVCCGRGTREHESLLVTDASASSIQAGLLALGLQPGAPGHWRQGAGGQLEEQPPLGSPVDVSVRWVEGGVAREVPIAQWLEDRRSGAGETRFVFAGSRFVNTRQGQRFAADLSGSVVGLVTFGDEVVACTQVVPDRVDVSPPRWRARTSAMPPEGTSVTMVLRRAPSP